MKTKLLLSLLLSFIFCLLSSQVPQGFNYQAIARDGSGNPLAGQLLQVELSMQTDTTATPNVLWSELFNPVTTNAFGLFTVVIGKGVRQSGAASFADINWVSKPVFMKTRIYYSGSWRYMGSSKLWSVPYSLISSSLSGPLKKLGVKGETTDPDSVLFEVKNSTGQTIFAVYNEGVRIYVDDGKAKGAKGGFAVGGFGTVTKTGESQEYFRITRDSARIYVADSVKGVKGGFAVGGFSPTKSQPYNFMNLTVKNYFIGHLAGYSNTTGLYNSYLGYKSGYTNKIGNYNTFMGYEAGYTTDAGYNTFIGYQAGRSNSSGDGNLFLGYTAGLANAGGYRNVFIGYNAGKYNINGWENTFVGGHAGYGFTAGNANIMLGTYAGNYFAGGNNNIFIGNSSGFAHKYSTDQASNNIFVGVEAGKGITTGGDNAFIGTKTGYSITTGINNVFIGNQSGYSNTAGYNNIFIGYMAGLNANANTNSTFIGNEAGKNITGDDNIAIGDQAGVNNYSTNSEMFGITILGIDAGRNFTGDYNTILGYGAGSKWGSAGTGTNNVFVGSQAGSGSFNSNNVCVGYKAGNGQSGSNKLFIANNEISPLIYGEFDNKKLRFNGNVGVNTDAGAIKLSSLDDVASNDNPAIFGQHTITAYYGIGVKGIGGWIGVRGEASLAGANTRYGVYGAASGGATNYGVYGEASGGTAYAGYFNGNVSATGYITAPSDKNLKKNILPMSGSLKKVLALQGVTYEWKSETELASVFQQKNEGGKNSEPKSLNFPKGTQLGVIAQDVEKILPELVQTDADGLKSVDYIKMIPLLIEAIKEQQAQIDELKAIINGHLQNK